MINLLFSQHNKQQWLSVDKTLPVTSSNFGEYNKEEDNSLRSVNLVFDCKIKKEEQERKEISSAQSN